MKEILTGIDIYITIYYNKFVRMPGIFTLYECICNDLGQVMILDIDKLSKVPIYFQLKQIIIDNINKGVWAPDSPIYSERELCEMFGISRMTIRQAINELVNEGILYRIRGKGTFVSPPKIEQSDVMSFTEAAVKYGYSTSTEVNIFKVIIPGSHIQCKLGLLDGEQVYYIQRLRIVENKIVAVEDVYLPVKYAENLQESDFTKSIYELLNKKFGYSINHVQTSMEALIPGEGELKLFNTNTNIPILKVTAVHITDNNLKLYYEESLYRSDKFILNINIYKG